MRIARSTGTFSGLVIAILGVWGALIPFVGPYFDYSFGVNSAWHYTTDRLWLCILPGALALLAGLILLAARTRTAGAFGGWLAIVAGAWFVIGPAVSLTWEAGPGPIGSPLFGSARQMAELIGYFYGLGALIVAFGAFAAGRFAPGPRLVEHTGPTAGEPLPRGGERWQGDGEPPRTTRGGEEAPQGAPVRRRSRLHLGRRSGTTA
jgi:hypothetical protein